MTPSTITRRKIRIMATMVVGGSLVFCVTAITWILRCEYVSLRSEAASIDHFVKLRGVSASEQRGLARCVGISSQRVTMLSLGSSQVCAGSPLGFANQVARSYSGRLGPTPVAPTDADVRHVMNFPYLEHLSVQGEALTAKSIAYIIKCRQLRRLRIGFPFLDDGAMSELKTLPELERLELVSDCVSEEALEAFSKARPDVDLVLLPASPAANIPPSPHDEREAAEASYDQMIHDYIRAHGTGVVN